MIRYSVTIMCCLGNILLYCMRMNMSIAITAMVRTTGTNVSITNVTEHVSKNAVIFDWDERTQQLILGAFYIGYAIMPIAGGWWAGNIGGKLVFGFGVFWTCVLATLIPIVSGISADLLIVLRVLEGIGQGVVTPAMYVIVGKWAASNEKSTMVSISLSGMCIGSTVSSYLTAWLGSRTSIFGGWPLPFYVYSFIGGIWVIAWALFIYETPDEHPYISQSEIEHIKASQSQVQQKKLEYVPWLKIITSPAVLAVTVGYFVFDFGFYILFTNIPTFFSSIFGCDLKTIGLLAFVAHMTQLIISMSCGFIADFLICGHYFSVVNTRKVIVVLTLGVPSACLVILGYAGYNILIAEILITLAFGCYGFNPAGIGSSPMDFAPRYTGIIVGIMISLSSCTGFIGPLILGELIENKNTLNQWRLIFVITACLQIFGMLMFLCFARGEEQNWAKCKAESMEEMSLINGDEDSASLIRDDDAK